MTKTLEELHREGNEEFRKIFAKENEFWREPFVEATCFTLELFMLVEREKAWKAGQLSGVELAKGRLPDPFDDCDTYGLSDARDSGHTEGFGNACRMAITSLTNLQGELGK